MFCASLITFKNLIRFGLNIGYTTADQVRFVLVGNESSSDVARSKGKDGLCLHSELFLAFWRKMLVGSIPFIFLFPPLSLCPSEPHLPESVLFLCHLYLELIFSIIPLPLFPVCFFFFFVPSSVRSWALRSGSGWRVLEVRAWRAGRRPSMTANAVPLATRWWAAASW